MPAGDTKPYGRAVTAICALALSIPAGLSVAQAHADPPLPGFCVPAVVVDDVCTVRLASVTADAVDATITGIPVGGGEAVTLAGQGDAYVKSVGFGAAPPEPVRNWDETIDRVGGLEVDPLDPSWYGNAKAKAFLPRTLNELATQFPPDSLVVRFAFDETGSVPFRLVSIQPTSG